MTGRPSKSKFPTLSDHRTTLVTALPLGISYGGGMLIGVTDSIMLGRLSTDPDRGAGLLGGCSSVRPAARVCHGFGCPGIPDRADPRQSGCRYLVSTALPAVGESGLMPAG